MAVAKPLQLQLELKGCGCGVTDSHFVCFEGRQLRPFQAQACPSPALPLLRAGLHVPALPVLLHRPRIFELGALGLEQWTTIPQPSNGSSGASGSSSFFFLPLLIVCGG